MKTKKTTKKEKEPIFLPDISGNATVKGRKIQLARSPEASVMIEIMKDCRTQLMSVIADDQFKTIVNALTLELEAELIRKVVLYCESIRNGTHEILQ